MAVVKIKKFKGSEIYKRLIHPLGYGLFQKESDTSDRVDHIKGSLHFDKLRHLDYIHPDHLGSVFGKDLSRFFRAISKEYRNQSQNRSRLQFDPVRNLKRIIALGYDIVGFVNHENHIINAKGSFQVLLRERSSFPSSSLSDYQSSRHMIVYEDDFRDIGSTLKLRMGNWTALDICKNSSSYLPLRFVISHRRENKTSCLEGITNAVKYAK